MVVTIFWSIVLDDHWSKTIIRPRRIVGPVLLFILRWSCFLYRPTTLIIRLIPHWNPTNRETCALFLILETEWMFCDVWIVFSQCPPINIFPLIIFWYHAQNILTILSQYGWSLPLPCGHCWPFFSPVQKCLHSYKIPFIAALDIMSKRWHCL